MKKTLNITGATLLSHFAVASPNPASQAWVTANFVAKNPPAINWSILCQNNQSLLSSSGCSPDCNSSAMASTCQQLYQSSQIERLSFISTPYNSNGVFVFQLNPSQENTSSSFTIKLSAVPNTNQGYICETLYGDGTPAPLWNTIGQFFSTTIAMDSTCTLNNGGCLSNNYTNFVTQQANIGGVTNYWYNNPNIPLYMLCLSYQQMGANGTLAFLQSSPGCSGTNASQSCVSYSLQ